VHGDGVTLTRRSRVFQTTATALYAISSILNGAAPPQTFASAQSTSAVSLHGASCSQPNKMSASLYTQHAHSDWMGILWHTSAYSKKLGITVHRTQ